MINTQQGFTFIELLITLSLISILAILSLHYAPFFTHQHEQILKTQFKSLLETAQQESLNGYDIGLCRSKGTNECENKGDTWLLFRDINGDKQVISKHYLAINKGKVDLRSYPRYRNYLQFSSELLAENDNATITYYRKDQSLAWQLVINKFGRIKEINYQQSFS